MKKFGMLALAFLLIGTFAFAQETIPVEINLGFILDVDKEKDVDALVAPGVDLGLRAYILELGNEFQPLNIGVAGEVSIGFPGAINWKVPGIHDLKKDESTGNAFWPGGEFNPETEDPEPIKVGSQTLLPGKTVQFSKAKGDFDGDASLINVSFMIGLSFQVGVADGLVAVADLGFGGSYDNATFKSPEYDSEIETGKKERQSIELSTFNGGIGGNLGMQYRIPLEGKAAFVIEVGSGLYAFFSRTSQVDWYTERDGDKKETLWKDKTDPEKINMFRAAPYVKVGLSF